MRRAYSFVYIINIILGLILSFLFLFIINYKALSYYMFIPLCIFYIISAIIFFKKRRKIETVDKVVLYLYLFFTMFMLIINVLLQKVFNNESFIYYNFYIYIYHMLFILYNYFI